MADGLEHHLQPDDSIEIPEPNAECGIRNAELKREVRSRMSAAPLDGAPIYSAFPFRTGDGVFAAGHDARTNYVALFGAIAQIIASAVPTFLAKMINDAVCVRLAESTSIRFGAASWNGTSTIAIIVVATK